MAARSSKLNKKEYDKLYYLKNKEKKKLLRAARKQQVEEYNKAYRIRNRALIAEKNSKYIKERSKVDLNFKLSRQLRVRLNIALKRSVKSGSAVSDLGCSIEELKSYLESKFELGMNWNNYGLRGWHIDHVIPLCTFDLTNREEFLKACHYTNLQPLWWTANLKKSKRVC